MVEINRRRNTKVYEVVTRGYTSFIDNASNLVTSGGITLFRTLLYSYTVV